MILKIVELKKDSVYIVCLTGKLDATTSPEFREKLMSVVSQGDRYLLIDCSDLEYISSAGLRVFFEVAYKIDELSGKIVCCSLNSNVRKVFDMVELSSEVPVFSTQEEAFQEAKG